jgi:hypothetical protein
MILTRSFQFSAGEGRYSARLLLGSSGTRRVGDEQVESWFILFPAVPAQLIPSAGHLSYYEVRTWETDEILQVDGTSASLYYPRHWVDSAGLMTYVSPGTVVIEEVAEIGSPTASIGAMPFPTYDPLANAIVTPDPVKKLYRVHYKAKYIIFAIRREGSAVKRAGNLWAIYRGESASADIPRIEPNWMTAWTVSSDYVADESGAWELPDNWPDENTYARYEEQEPLPDQSSYQQLRRRHEVGQLSDYGELEIISNDFPYLQPYDNEVLPTWHPDYEYRKGTAPEAGSDFYEHWERLDWASIEAGVRKRWEDVTI